MQQRTKHTRLSRIINLLPPSSFYLCVRVFEYLSKPQPLQLLSGGCCLGSLQAVSATWDFFGGWGSQCYWVDSHTPGLWAVPSGDKGAWRVAASQHGGGQFAAVGGGGGGVSSDWNISLHPLNWGSRSCVDSRASIDSESWTLCVCVCVHFFSAFSFSRYGHTEHLYSTCSYIFYIFFFPIGTGTSSWHRKHSGFRLSSELSRLTFGDPLTSYSAIIRSKCPFCPTLYDNGPSYQHQLFLALSSNLQIWACRRKHQHVIIGMNPKGPNMRRMQTRKGRLGKTFCHYRTFLE